MIVRTSIITVQVGCITTMRLWWQRTQAKGSA